LKKGRPAHKVRKILGGEAKLSSEGKAGIAGKEP